MIEEGHSVYEFSHYRSPHLFVWASDMEQQKNIYISPQLFNFLWEYYHYPTPEFIRKVLEEYHYTPNENDIHIPYRELQKASSSGGYVNVAGVRVRLKIVFPEGITPDGEHASEIVVYPAEYCGFDPDPSYG